MSKGRILFTGGGGFVGTVQNQARTLYGHGGGPLQRGYATVGTDTGHVGGGIEASWALSAKPVCFQALKLPSLRAASGLGG